MIAYLIFIYNLTHDRDAPPESDEGVMWMRYFPEDGEFEPNYEGEFRGEFDDTPDTYDDNTTVEERF